MLRLGFRDTTSDDINQLFRTDKSFSTGNGLTSCQLNLYTFELAAMINARPNVNKQPESPIISYYYLLIFTGKNIKKDNIFNLYLNLNEKTYTSTYGKRRAAGAITFFLYLSLWHLSALAVDAAIFLFVIGCTHNRGIGNNNGRCSFNQLDLT